MCASILIAHLLAAYFVVIEYNDTFVSCIATEKETFRETLNVTAWVHGKGNAAADGIHFEYDAAIDAVINNEGSLGGPRFECVKRGKWQQQRQTATNSFATNTPESKRQP